MSELHPIQLRDIVVTRLSCVVHDPVAARTFDGSVDLDIKSGTSEISEGSSAVAVGIKASVKPANPNKDNESWTPAFEIDVELNGQFEIDLEKFAFEFLPDWAKINAPFLLLPYVREHVFGLAHRVGMSGLLLPFFVQPRPIPTRT